MPNHVNNTLAVEGDPKLVQDFINKATENGKTEFSFQNLYPMPDELKIRSGSAISNAVDYYKCISGDIDTLNKWCSYECIKVYFPKLADLGEMRSIVIGYMLEDLDNEDLYEGSLAISNMQKYGCQDWYSWRNKHWGTKWDCYDVEDTFCDSTNKDGIREAYWNFDTAWDMPRGLIRFLTRQFPELVFDIESKCESGWKEHLKMIDARIIYSEYIESTYEDEYKEDA